MLIKGNKTRNSSTDEILGLREKSKRKDSKSYLNVPLENIRVK